MDLSGRRIALYGRMLDRPRAQAAALIARRGGTVERDLTRRTQLLVVGRGSLGLIPSGQLGRQLDRAAAQGTPVIGEQRLSDLLDGHDTPRPTYPLDRIAPSPPDRLVRLLNAFDLVHATADDCRFGDVEVLRTAMTLQEDGHEMSSLVRVLLRARAAPPGRFRIVSHGGEARLNWGDAVTSLDGQGLLPLPEQPDLDDVFDAALLAEAEGRLDDAAQGYALCVRMDRRDPIAPFNLANVLAEQGAPADALTRLDQAIARDPGFAEAYYNRARIFEDQGDLDRAMANLRLALDADPDFSRALFNLAQLELQSQHPHRAIDLFDRFLERDPDPDWRAIALKARSVAAAMLARTGAHGSGTS